MSRDKGAPLLVLSQLESGLRVALVVPGVKVA
jgi:hypothetical protein